MIESLKTLLRAQTFGSDETAVGERVFSDFIPAGNPRPMIVLKKNGTNNLGTMAGLDETRIADVDLFIVATNKADADSIADEVEEFLDAIDDDDSVDGIQFDCVILNDRDDESLKPEDGSDERDIFTRLVTSIRFTME